MTVDSTTQEELPAVNRDALQPTVPTREEAKRLLEFAAYLETNATVANQAAEAAKREADRTGRIAAAARARAEHAWLVAQLAVRSHAIGRPMPSQADRAREERRYEEAAIASAELGVPASAKHGDKFTAPDGRVFEIIESAGGLYIFPQVPT